MTGKRVNYTLLCNECNLQIDYRKFSHANIYCLSTDRRCKECARKHRKMKRIKLSRSWFELKGVT